MVDFNNDYSLDFSISEKAGDGTKHSYVAQCFVKNSRGMEFQILRPQYRQLAFTGGDGQYTVTWINQLMTLPHKMPSAIICTLNMKTIQYFVSYLQTLLPKVKSERSQIIPPNQQCKTKSPKGIYTLELQPLIRPMLQVLSPMVINDPATGLQSETLQCQSSRFKQRNLITNNSKIRCHVIFFSSTED